MVNIIELLANSSNYGSTRNTSSIKYIVIHYTANSGDTALNNATYFQGANRSASAHYFVDENSIYRSVRDNVVAWSVGGGKYSDYAVTGGAKYYKIATNANTLNIELCNAKKNTLSEVSKATINNAAELVAAKMKEYNISIDHVITHHLVNGKHCPLFMMNSGALNEFKNIVMSYYNGGSVTVSDNNTSNTSTSTTKQVYRIRKTWKDASSQIGAYSSLDNAKKACKDGYSVFDSNGNVVYTKVTSSASNTNSSSYTSQNDSLISVNFKKVSTPALNVTANIRGVQTWLNTYYNAGLVVDGSAGSLTMAALIAAWQLEDGTLAVDGSFGSASQSRANLHYIVRGSKGIYVTIWQCVLVCRGYNPNGIDGSFGGGCDSATRLFQKNKGLTQDGSVGRNTITRGFKG